MTSVYVTNVVRKVRVTPGAAAGGGGGGSNFPALDNTWTGINTFTGRVTINSGATGTTPLTVKGIVGQTAPLTEWRNSSDAVTASVDPAGQFVTTTNMLVGGGVSAGGGNKVIVLTNATAPSSNPTGGGILYAESGALKYRDSSGGIYVPIPASGIKGDLLAHNGTSWIKVSAGTNNYVLTADSSVSAGLKWAASAGGGGAGHTIQDEGSSLTQRTIMDFQGAGVVASDNGSKTVVTITGGSSFYQTVQANGTARTQRAATNYSTAFTATDNAGSNRTDIGIVTDQAAGTASLRTLGSGSTQAAAGNHAHAYDPSGTAAAAVAAHAGAADPHVDYLLQTEADVLYASVSNVPPTGGSTGQVLAKNSNANYDFVWQSGSASLTIPYTAVGTSTGTVPFAVKGFAGQTADIFQVMDSANSVFFNVFSDGRIVAGPGGSALEATLNTRPVTSTTKGFIIKARAGQTENLMEVRTSTDGMLMSIGANGTITAPNIGPKLVVLNAVQAVPGGTAAGSVILRRP